MLNDLLLLVCELVKSEFSRAQVQEIGDNKSYSDKELVEDSEIKHLLCASCFVMLA